MSIDEARKTALAVVPHGKVQSEELEREKGLLIYSFDIKIGRKSGIEEVAVDAVTGKIVEKKHESAKSERAEKKADKKKA
ncbi:MAG: PepSY domain-containing protein [Acidobacteriota bacterium]|nr:PepSY domain-containing protein [Acidobacteriota bacterium]